jgi:hypothetical protein
MSPSSSTVPIHLEIRSRENNVANLMPCDDSIPALVHSSVELKQKPYFSHSSIDVIRRAKLCIIIGMLFILLLVYVFLLLCKCRSWYSLSLCCSMYCLYINVYCTTATGYHPLAVNKYIMSFDSLYNSTN